MCFKGILGMATRRERLQITPAGMRWEARSCFGGRSEELRLDEIEEVALGPRTGREARRPTQVCVIGDRAEIRFGTLVSDEELAWLRDCVCLAIERAARKKEVLQ